MDSELRALIDATTEHFTVVVIGGMAKTGTSLPLTLLDSHPALLVFPEELRFFDLGCDLPRGDEAADRLFSNGNIELLKTQGADFGPEDYMAHGGTGFGKRDYSDFDFPRFEDLVRRAFRSTTLSRERFFSVVAAFALSKRELTDSGKVAFVCKAPHNELYATKWATMLGQDAKYIICTRDPVEHYLSLCNVARLAGGPAPDPRVYARTLKERRRLWDRFPSDRVFVLDYDQLIGRTGDTMKQVCGFLGIEFSDVLLRPTKNGVPWSGNSTRGRVASTVFENPKIARRQLSHRVVRSLDVRLHRFMVERGYGPGVAPTSFEVLGAECSDRITLGVGELRRMIRGAARRIPFARALHRKLTGSARTPGRA